MNRIGSLCTGYGGLDMAVELVLGGEMVWYSEFDKHPSTLLSVRFPGIPNLGDLTKIDWGTVSPVDILTGGYPCQPFSAAGKRLGEDDPRHLWPYIRKAVRILRPRLTILENVAGHRSMGFATVLRDCAEDGLDVRWVSVRASDAGAPHKRERLFFVISNPEGVRQPAAGGLPQVTWTSPDGSSEATSDPERFGRFGIEDTEGGEGNEGSSRPPERGEAVANPSSFDVGEARNGRDGSTHNYRISWGDYEHGIRRWESILGRPAPDPTEPNKNGRPRLTAAFDEWMMGLPEGWVTDIDIPYGAQIKLMGNGVVPHQAALAIWDLTWNGEEYG